MQTDAVAFNGESRGVACLFGGVKRLRVDGDALSVRSWAVPYEPDALREMRWALSHPLGDIAFGPCGAAWLPEGASEREASLVGGRKGSYVDLGARVGITSSRGDIIFAGNTVQRWCPWNADNRVDTMWFPQMPIAALTPCDTGGFRAVTADAGVVCWNFPFSERPDAVLTERAPWHLGPAAPSLQEVQRHIRDPGVRGAARVEGNRVAVFSLRHVLLWDPREGGTPRVLELLTAVREARQHGKHEAAILSTDNAMLVFDPRSERVREISGVREALRDREGEDRRAVQTAREGAKAAVVDSVALDAAEERLRARGSGYSGHSLRSQGGTAFVLGPFGTLRCRETGPDWLGDEPATHFSALSEATWATLHAGKLTVSCRGAVSTLTDDGAEVGEADGPPVPRLHGEDDPRGTRHLGSPLEEEPAGRVRGVGGGLAGLGAEGGNVVQAAQEAQRARQEAEQKIAEAAARLLERLEELRGVAARGA